MESKALETMGKSTMLERVKKAKFPQQLTPAEMDMLAEAAITYGFDPLMGELTIYQGRPFVSIDGRYRKARETGKLDGVQSRPATKEEKAEWEIPDGDYFFRAEVLVKDMKLPFVGWGRVLKSETIGGKGYKPVETNPQRMAEKRAEAQALRKAFSIPLPSIEDIALDERGNGKTTITIETPAALQADPETGEIKEEPPEELFPEETPATSAGKPPTSKAPITPGKIDGWGEVGQYVAKAGVSQDAVKAEASKILMGAKIPYLLHIGNAWDKMSEEWKASPESCGTPFAFAVAIVDKLKAAGK